MNTKQPLPIHQLLPTLAQTLSEQEITLLSAEPGAGKTTQVPVFLQSLDIYTDTRIIMTAPRRVAAQAAATYMAQCMGEKVGETIGYRVKQDTRCGPNTRVEIVTTGVLLRMLQSDPMLSGVDLVILDEFHERSLENDLVLALCRQMNLLYRDDNPVKLLIMSATLAQDELEQALETPILFCPGRTFPIEEHYTAQSSRLSDRTALATQVCQNALEQEKGDLLCFLPGVYEIEQVRRHLQNYCDSWGYDLRVLHGQQKLEEQKATLATSSERRVILATSIAETSLTIDGVTIVVDSGLAREARFDKHTGLSQLHTRPVTLAEATQRAGRAGRTQAGSVYRCWNRAQQDNLSKHSEPEISRQDLSPLAYQLIQWGSDDYSEFDWVTPPNESRWKSAITQLARLRLIEPENQQYQLTNDGLAAAKLPLAPHLAKAWVELNRQFSSLDDLKAAACIVAFLQEIGQSREPELFLALEHLLSEQQASPQQKRCIKSAGQLLGSKAGRIEVRSVISQLHTSTFVQKVSKALLMAFPLQLAFSAYVAANPQQGLNDQQVNQSQSLFKLANGRQAELKNGQAGHYLLALHTRSRTDQDRETLSLYLALNSSDIEHCLKHLIKEEDICQWQNGRLVNERIRSIGQLALQQKKSHAVDPELLTQAGIDRVNKEGIKCLPWNKSSQQLHERLLFAFQQQPENWPDMTEMGLLQQADQWLAPYLSDVSSQKQWQQLPVSEMLLSLLPWDKQQSFNKLVPKTFHAATGQQVALDYSEHRPTMHIKLQAMFGTECVPDILGSAVNISLLSPAGRPLAVTANLTTFWRDVYPEVRKEMRGRYPKHPWPEDPITAVATHKTKRQLK